MCVKKWGSRYLTKKPNLKIEFFANVLAKAVLPKGYVGTTEHAVQTTLTVNATHRNTCESRVSFCLWWIISSWK